MCVVAIGDPTGKLNIDFYLAVRFGCEKASAGAIKSTTKGHSKAVNSTLWFISMLI